MELHGKTTIQLFVRLRGKTTLTEDSACKRIRFLVLITLIGLNVMMHMSTMRMLRWSSLDRNCWPFHLAIFPR